MDARLNLYGNPVGAKIQRYVNSAGTFHPSLGKLRAQCRSKAAVGTCAIRPLKRLPAGQGGGRVTLG
jgi:hypothetical protein